MGGDHKCPVCQATFTRPQHVARHMRSHTGDRPYKCQHCGDQFARSDLLSRHINKCHPDLKSSGANSALNSNTENSSSTNSGTTTRRKNTHAANRATTSKQACDQCVLGSLPCDGANPCAKCIQRKCRCTFVKFHRQTAPVGPGHNNTPQQMGPYNFSAPLPSLIHGERGIGGGVPTRAMPYSVPHMHPHGSISVDDLMLTTAPSSGYSQQLPYARTNQPQFSFPPPHPQSHIPTSNGMNFDLPESTAEYAAKYRTQAELIHRINPPNSFGYSQSAPRPGWNGGNPWPGAATANSDFSGDEHDQFGPAPHLPQTGFGSPSNNDMYRDRRESSIESTFSADRGRRYSHAASTSSTDDGRFAYSGSGGPTRSGSAASSSAHLPLDMDPYHDLPRSSHSHQSSDSSHDPAFSAFGLMSLDDPSVEELAPFFTSAAISAAPQDPGATPMPNTSLRKAVGAGETLTTGLTPRELETRELREFWKQYMRTPLTGPGSSAILSGNNNNAGNPHLPQHSNAGPVNGGRRQRVNSLPSVTTPTAELYGNGSSYYVPGYPSFAANIAFDANNANHNVGGINDNRPGSSSGAVQLQNIINNSTRSSNLDDLRRYEAAVMARKAPTTLKLPSRARGSSGTQHPHDESVSPPMPQQLLDHHLHPSSSQQHLFHAQTVNPNANGSTSLSRAGSLTRPTSSASASSSELANVFGESPVIGGGSGENSMRPSFKRLPSQVLGPENAKRERRGYYPGNNEGGGWEELEEYEGEDNGDNGAEGGYTGAPTITV